MTTFEVVYRGEVFSFPTLRQMAVFARRLEREGFDVYCQARNGSVLARLNLGAVRLTV